VCCLGARLGEVSHLHHLDLIHELTISGPSYNSAEVFDLSTMGPYTLERLHSQLGSATSNLALYLPRTSDLRQLRNVVKLGEKAAVVHYCTDGGSRALCAYLGSGWKAPE
jgi:trimethylguanosine synthase